MDFYVYNDFTSDREKIITQQERNFKKEKI